MAKRVLIVDDDQAMADIIEDTLIEYGYEPSKAHSLEAAYELLSRQAVELIILDINLPDGTGFEFCKDLRKYSNVPIIFASARTMEDDRIKSYDIGGDDFLSKPYSLKELVSHVNALFRRTYNFTSEEKVTTFGDICVNSTLRTVTKGGAQVTLSLREFDLLDYLVNNKNVAVNKEKLLSEVWGAYNVVEPSTLTVHIRWLREKLEDDPSSPKYLITVRGVGYALKIDEA